MENRWNLLLNDILLWKEILSLESFRRIDVKKTVDDRKWLNTMTSIKGFVLTVICEFYANLSDDMDEEDSPYFQKVYVRGHAIADYLQILFYNKAERDEVYPMNAVASEIREF
ncbi:hypothetical protein TorRG33x02_237540 [Trema orientale]|uniref:Uncharacterized protein n=1 Tax=Trema orientale TaxID=63057 RepID=A0A2P5DZL3_TREOI|nr:hypothetical protein TorRG33x02_237540 [Trema orientale]